MRKRLFEHIIRHGRAMERIRQYVAANPARWASGPENPQRRGGEGFHRRMVSRAGPL